MLALTLPALLSSIGCGVALAGADYFRKAVPLSVPTDDAAMILRMLSALFVRLISRSRRTASTLEL